jgi:hypothetical protein
MKTRSSLSPFTLTLIAMSLTFGIVAAAIPTAAQLGATTLTVLAIPPNCTGLPGSNCQATTGPPITFFGAIQPTITNNTMTGFTGTWSSPVATAWQGMFTGTGSSYPDAETGTSSFDFTTLHAGYLPANTFLGFGDLDMGSSTDERFLLQAFNAAGLPITNAWLNGVDYCSNTLPSPVCANSPQYMPEYVWNGTSSSANVGVNGSSVPAYGYEFDGYDVVGNPTTGVWLNTNVNISYLTVTEFSIYDSMALAAPTPEPCSLLLMASGVVGLGGLLRRRRRG